MTTIEFPVLIGDIGGTNARFEILPDADSPAISFEHVRTADFDDIEAAVEQAVLAKSELKPVTAILAAAGPITPDGLDLTNCHWSIQPDCFLNFSSIERLILFNDFDAQALALPSLDASDLIAIGNSDRSLENKTKAVLGPGTGLGVGTLVYANDTWIPVGGEGGHVDLGPRTPREAKIWEHLDRFEGRVSAESILCGPGLVNAYNAICATDGVTPKHNLPEAISKAAIAGDDDLAAEALALFCRCLGRVAGDLAVTVMPLGGVYIAGGIAKKIAPFLQKSEFRAAFEDKAPHNALMAEIPTMLVMHDVPALLGLESFARNPGQFGIVLDHRHWQRGKTT